MSEVGRMEEERALESRMVCRSSSMDSPSARFALIVCTYVYIYTLVHVCHLDLRELCQLLRCRTEHCIPTKTGLLRADAPIF